MLSTCPAASPHGKTARLALKCGMSNVRVPCRTLGSSRGAVHGRNELRKRKTLLSTAGLWEPSSPLRRAHHHHPRLISLFLPNPYVHHYRRPSACPSLRFVVGS